MALIILLAALAQTAPTRADGTQSDCLAILSKQNLLTSSGSSASQIAYLSTLDETQFNELQKTQSVGGSVQYGVFSLSANASFQDFQTSLNQYKSSVSYNYSAQQAQSIATATTPSEAFNVYMQCLQNTANGVYVVAESSIVDSVQLHLSYHNPGAVNPAKVRLSLNGGLFPDGSTRSLFTIANDGSVNTNIKRQSGAPGLLVSANTEDGISTYGSGVSYPWNPIVAPQPLANTTLVMNAVPKGTILMWAGDLARIPSGWALCDGQTHNGITTINLTDSFPRGMSVGAVLGSNGGSFNQTINVSGTTDPPTAGSDKNVANGHDHHDFDAMGVDHEHNFHASNVNTIIPPYAFVYFIQKIL